MRDMATSAEIAKAYLDQEMKAANTQRFEVLLSKARLNLKRRLDEIEFGGQQDAIGTD